LSLTLSLSSEHREEWIRSKYVGKFFVEPKKGFLLVQWRDKGTAARTCFVQIKSKTVVIYDDEYPPKVGKRRIEVLNIDIKLIFC
jgi:hypothetical protein